MRVFSSPKLALSVSQAGGLGFIGPGTNAEATLTDLEALEGLQHAISHPCPVGVGFQLWNGHLPTAAKAVGKHRPAAVWLFAPRNGQSEIDEWTAALRDASPDTRIWVQVGTLKEALAAAGSLHAPDVLVLQGAESGGHGRAKDAVGIVTLLPEVADAIGPDIPLIAAGGIADGRGVAAALGLGAAGAAMGTRFLAATEARISKGYQDEVIRASDGAVSTGKTHLYNHLRGTFGWPEEWAPRGVLNRSWDEHSQGVNFEELRKRHDECVATQGDAAWGPEGRTATYAGASVGLVRSVSPGGEIVKNVRGEAREILTAAASFD